MPYKRIGTTVYQKKPSGWVRLKTHETDEEAEKHLVALRINVEHKE